MTTHAQATGPSIEEIKARQKATWESGDFGQVARYNVPAAEDFMSRLELRPGMRVLDVACGTGNLAVIAARAGCLTSGVDIAGNLIAQARVRAKETGLQIEFTEGDAEALPYADASFDLVVSMYGAMFAPRPEIVARELLRVARPGGLIALANWTPEGFIGRMFDVFKKHLPPPPKSVPSPLEWGSPGIVHNRFREGVRDLQFTRRIARLCYPFSPAETVEFFRKYYGPTHRAFASLSPAAQDALRSDLEELQELHNVSADPHETETVAEYLEIHARRDGNPFAS